MVSVAAIGVFKMMTDKEEPEEVAILTPDRAGVGSIGHPEVTPLHKIKAERVIPDTSTLVTEVRGTHTLAIHNYVLVAVSCKSAVKSICPEAVFLLSTENVGKLLHKLV